jgi:SSS family solute:Na+ symporter
MISTLIGGSSTIGTAQMGYSNGLSAWWFTLGSGIGCLLFGLRLVKPLRKTGYTTIQQIVSNEYGTALGVITSILSAIGIVINVMAQFLSANVLFTTMLGISPIYSSIIAVIVMICYVVFGGVLGTGILGNVKLILIYTAIIFGVYTISVSNGGFAHLYSVLPKEQYFNIFGRGMGVELGSLFSVLLGVLCGQTYVQTIMSGKNDSASIKGTIATALLLPPVGLGGAFIGMYMKVNYPSIESSQAFPLFVINHMPPILGGAILATLLLALVGTGSGMALGLGTIVTKDIYKKFIKKDADSASELFVSRVTIIICFVFSAIFAYANQNAIILSWTIISTGLRGVVLFVPMFGALFFKNRIDSRFAAASSILGVAALMAGNMMLDLTFDPLFLAMGVSMLIGILGMWVQSYQAGKKPI